MRKLVIRKYHVEVRFQKSRRSVIYAHKVVALNGFVYLRVVSGHCIMYEIKVSRDYILFELLRISYVETRFCLRQPSRSVINYLARP